MKKIPPMGVLSEKNTPYGAIILLEIGRFRANLVQNSPKWAIFGISTKYVLSSKTSRNSPISGYFEGFKPILGQNGQLFVRFATNRSAFRVRSYSTTITSRNHYLEVMISYVVRSTSVHYIRRVHSSITIVRHVVEQYERPISSK